LSNQVEKLDSGGKQTFHDGYEVARAVLESLEPKLPFQTLPQFQGFLAWLNQSVDNKNNSVID